MASVHPSAPPLNEISTPLYAEQAASPKKKKVVKKKEEAVAATEQQQQQQQEVSFKPEGLWLSAEDVPEELAMKLGCSRGTVYNRVVGAATAFEQDLPLEQILESLRTQVELRRKWIDPVCGGIKNSPASRFILDLFDSANKLWETYYRTPNVQPDVHLDNIHIALGRMSTLLTDTVRSLPFFKNGHVL